MRLMSIRNPTHYQVLEVPHDSTQEDIKSAYYKLTKIYHPDVNKTEEAKIKFQAISNAYEILSHYTKRKDYDRQLLIKGDIKKSNYYSPVPEDPIASFHRTRATNFNPMKTDTNQKKIYNFDAWYDAHYRQTFARRKEGRAAQVFRMREREIDPDISNNTDLANIMTVVLAILIVSAVVGIKSMGSDFDKDQISNNNNKTEPKKENSPR